MSISETMHGLTRSMSAFAPVASSRATLLVVLAILAFIVTAVVVAVILLPPQTKVVRRRKVRRVRRAVPVAESTSAKEVAAPTIPSAEASQPRRWRAFVPVLFWLVLVIGVFWATYAVTGTARYCGESCHLASRHVALAVRYPHGDCIDCHESGPISGMASRFRMAYSHQMGVRRIVSAPIDPARCTGCHRQLTKSTIVTRTGLKVSHTEILAGGRTCSDCHASVGHRRGSSLAVGMASCMGCHNGVKASRECRVCHRQGSPIASVAPLRKDSSFEYPAVRVANRNCARCHGTQTECIECHNGFVLPHPTVFVRGGHARVAAFGGKERCFKCHEIAWCGSGKCHHNFSAHNEKIWPREHQAGTSAQCGSCHLSWSGRGDFCRLCH